jgi:hypothetical protein
VRDLAGTQSERTAFGRPPSWAGVSPGRAPLPHFALPPSPHLRWPRCQLSSTCASGAGLSAAFGRCPATSSQLVAGAAAEGLVGVRMRRSASVIRMLSGRLEHLGPQLQALFHQLEVVDRREGGQHGVLPLIAQAPRREQRPGASSHRARAPRTRRPRRGRPAAGRSGRAPTRSSPSPRGRCGGRRARPRRRVGVQHLVLRNGGDDQRDRRGFEQRALGLGGRSLAASLLLDDAAAIQLAQHAVEHRSPGGRFVSPNPRTHAACGRRCGAPRRPRRRGGAAAARSGARPNHHAQDQQQQRQRGAEVHPHALEQAVDPRVASRPSSALPGPAQAASRSPSRQALRRPPSMIGAKWRCRRRCRRRSRPGAKGVDALRQQLCFVRLQRCGQLRRRRHRLRHGRSRWTDATASRRPSSHQVGVCAPGQVDARRRSAPGAEAGPCRAHVEAVRGSAARSATSCSSCRGRVEDQVRLVADAGDQRGRAAPTRPRVRHQRHRRGSAVSRAALGGKRAREFAAVHRRAPNHASFGFEHGSRRVHLPRRSPSGSERSRSAAMYSLHRRSPCARSRWR